MIRGLGKNMTSGVMYYVQSTTPYSIPQVPSLPVSINAKAAQTSTSSPEPNRIEPRRIQVGSYMTVGSYDCLYIHHGQVYNVEKSIAFVDGISCIDLLTSALLPEK